MKVIRISDIVHEQLKKEAKQQGRTLQWLVEERLTTPSASPTPQEYVEAWNKGAQNKLNVPLLDPENYRGADALEDDWEEVGKKELPVCCGNRKTRCKHWVWDIQRGEGYVNSITGEILEIN